jgi:glycosyltransferase involved in cell wall biosynthesis
VDIVISAGQEIQVFIIGDGCERSSLEAFVRSRPGLTGRVTFTGAVSNVADWLNALDVFVLTSLSEGMSNTIMESMSAELPIVATAAAGNELLEHRSSGLLVPERDVQALAESLSLLIADPLLRTTLGKNARIRAEKNFSLRRMVEEYSRIYTKFGRGRGSSPSAYS